MIRTKATSQSKAISLLPFTENKTHSHTPHSGKGKDGWEWDVEKVQQGKYTALPPLPERLGCGHWKTGAEEKRQGHYSFATRETIICSHSSTHNVLSKRHASTASRLEADYNFLIRKKNTVGGGSGWGTHVNPWLIHVNVWQKPLQYCKVISLQWIKINEKKEKKNTSTVVEKLGSRYEKASDKTRNTIGQ